MKNRHRIKEYIASSNKAKTTGHNTLKFGKKIKEINL